MTTAPTSVREPNPAIIFDTMNAYQRSFALKSAIELDIFTQIGRGNDTVDGIANAVGASPRGVRILCDFLVVCGFLEKHGNRYSLSIDAATFLDRSSPAYFGIAAGFLLSRDLIGPFLDLTQVVRAGRTTMPDQGTVSKDNPIWVDFARNMAAMVYPSAVEIADLVAGTGDLRVLDVAAGHGLFGITIAQRNPSAYVTALDWANVLAVATENARKFGVADRHATIAGDAFQVDFGGPYDLVLVTNFFHHFDPPVCEKLMRKIHAALAHGGRCVNLEFIPNDDRVSPPTAAAFALMMLGTTVAGDVYTFAEYDSMFRNAGFARTELHTPARSPEAITIATKA
jgi:2-polyprenyl-3-methyl-5-hydroxy-6-metoxy-1,4-benzoquinol methylase